MVDFIVHSELAEYNNRKCGLTVTDDHCGMILFDPK